jgi:hypothetical protein
MIARALQRPQQGRVEKKLAKEKNKLRPKTSSPTWLPAAGMNMLQSTSQQGNNFDFLATTHFSTAAEPLARITRPAHPTYDEEHKFFVMYYRVLKELSWPEIRDKFATFFDVSSRTFTGNQLTSLYYRTRKDWGMEEALKTGDDVNMRDRGTVEGKAAHFDREFLTSLGYFD